MAINNVIEQANYVISEAEDAYIYFLFEWQKELDRKQCFCPNCQRERVKVKEMLQKEALRLEKRRQSV
jgi:hypothetical protein